MTQAFAFLLMFLLVVIVIVSTAILIVLGAVLVAVKKGANEIIKGLVAIHDRQAVAK